MLSGSRSVVFPGGDHSHSGTAFTTWLDFSQAAQQAEAIYLQQLHEQYRQQGVKIIGISFDRKADQLKTYLTTNKITYDVINDRQLTTLKTYKVSILPTLLVIDRQGKIIKTYVDFDDNIRSALSNQLAELTGNTE